MTSEPEKLLPCPFCKSDNLSIEVHDVQPDNYHGGYVTCGDCDAQGADAISLDGWLNSPAEARAAAITAWNTRLSSPVSGTNMVMVEAWALVNRLRDQEADSVTVLCDNPEGPPNNAVECCGFWTGFAERRFEGETIVAALQNAVSAKDAADQAGHPEMSAALGDQRSATAEMAFQAGWNAKERDVRDQLWDYDVHEAYDEFRARQALAFRQPAGVGPIPVIAEVGERERIARIVREYCKDGVRPEPFGGSLDTADLAADAILSTPATLDNTAVEEATAVIRAHAAKIGVPAITIAAATLTAKTEKAE